MSAGECYLYLLTHTLIFQFTAISDNIAENLTRQMSNTVHVVFEIVPYEHQQHVNDEVALATCWQSFTDLGQSSSHTQNKGRFWWCSTMYNIWL